MPSLCLGQQDTVVIKDFSNAWTFFNDGQNLPLVRKSDFKGNVIRFDVDVRDFDGAYLSIQSPQEISLFVDGVLQRVTYKKLILDFEEIKTGNNVVSLTIYAEGLNPYSLNTHAIKILAANYDPLRNDVVIVNPRAARTFSNFFIMGLTILAIYFAVLSNFYPRVVSEYYNFRRAISARESDENLLKSRPLNSTNIYVYIFFSLLLSFIILSLAYLSNSFPEVSLFYPTSFANALWNWAELTLTILALLVFKFALIVYFTRLFAITGFTNNHLFNFIRLSLMSVSAMLLVLVIFQLGFLDFSQNSFEKLLLYILITLAPISFIIYLKLMNAAPFKNLHLFSYLCATELIPFVIILSLGMNESF